MEGDEDNGDNTCRFDGASGAPADLMHKLVKRSRSPPEREEKEELELSLGLSMNGRFGVDPAMKKIRRSSSVSNVVYNVDCAGNGGERKPSGVELGGHAPLPRTCSLPPGTLREEGRTGMEGLHGGGNGCSAVKMGHDMLEKRHTQLFPTGSRGLQSQLFEGTPSSSSLISILFLAQTQDMCVCVSVLERMFLLLLKCVCVCISV